MNLEQKLKGLAERKRQDQVAWEQQKTEWISDVSRLYDDIEAWMQDWVEKGYLRTYRRILPRSEEYLGDYEIESLEIAVGDRTIVFEPVARNVIKACGRIDVYLIGFRAEAQMLLLIGDKQAGKLHWELSKSRYDGLRMPFNKDTFEGLMDEWL